MDIKGKTESGFEYSIDPKRLDNYELLEGIVELEENPTNVPAVLKMLLGTDQVKKLKEHVRGEDGIVPAAKMLTEIKEIFENQAQTKNS